MNRKQKVLTIIALIAFVVIGSGHNLAWPLLVLHEDRDVPYTVWEEVTYDAAPQNVRQAFVDRLLEQGGYTDSKGQWQTYPVATPTPTPARARLATDSKPHPKDGFDASYVPGGFNPRLFLNGVQPRDSHQIPLDAKLWFPVEKFTTERVWRPRLSITVRLRVTRWFPMCECRGSCSA
jgi:hypothetical protein